jgi:hypothetical protein
LFYKKEFAMRMHLAAWMAVIVFGLGGFSVAKAGIWTNGHGDIDVHFHETEGKLELGLHFETPVGTVGGGVISPGHYEADEHQIFVPGPTVKRPSGPIWNFAGNENDDLWFLPGNSDPLKPYLGWSREDLSSSEWTDVTFKYLSISGPAGGVFSVWATDTFTGQPIVKLSSALSSSEFTLTEGHEHFNVAFNREGQFDVEIEVSARRLSDNMVFEGQGTFTFYSGSTPSGGEVPEPASITVFAAFALGAAYRMKRRKTASAV